MWNLLSLPHQPKIFDKSELLLALPNMRVVDAGICVVDDNLFIIGAFNNTQKRTIATLNLTDENTLHLSSAPFDLPSPVCAVYNGLIYYFDHIANVVRLYNPDNKQWFSMGSSIQLTYNRAITYGSRIYIFGGTDSGNNLYADLNVFNPQTGQWSDIPKVGEWPSARAHYAACAMGNKMYLHGGYSYINPENPSENSAQSSELWEFDFITERFTRLADSPVGMHTHQIAVHEGRIYTGGSWINDPKNGSIYEYDPLTNLWRLAFEQNYGLWGTGFVIHNGVGYLIGGTTDATPGNATGDIVKLSLAK